MNYPVTIHPAHQEEIKSRIQKLEQKAKNNYLIKKNNITLDYSYVYTLFERLVTAFIRKNST